MMEVKLSERRGLLPFIKLLPRPTFPSQSSSVLSLHNNFRGFTQVQSVLVLFLFFHIFFPCLRIVVATWFILQSLLNTCLKQATYFVMSEMEVSDSGYLKGWTAHQALLGSCYQRVMLKIKNFILFTCRKTILAFGMWPSRSFIWFLAVRLIHAQLVIWSELMLSVWGFYGYGSCWLLTKLVDHFRI